MSGGAFNRTPSTDDVEGPDDVDGDGVHNYLDTDWDGDGVPDAEEGTDDSDDDGSPNVVDPESGTDDDGDDDPVSDGTATAPPSTTQPNASQPAVGVQGHCSLFGLHYGSFVACWYWRVLLDGLVAALLSYGRSRRKPRASARG